MNYADQHTPFTAWVGIDWGDISRSYCSCLPAGTCTQKSCASSYCGGGTLEELQRSPTDEIRAFFKQCRLQDKTIEQCLAKVKPAVPLTKDSAIVTSGCFYAQAMARQLLELSDAIARCDVKLEELMQTHPDASLFTGLPGAGDAMAPRLLAAYGTDRDRIDGAQDMQSYSGFAPVTRRSGKTKIAVRRWACPVFIKAICHDILDISVRVFVNLPLWQTRQEDWRVVCGKNVS